MLVANVFFVFFVFVKSNEHGRRGVPSIVVDRKLEDHAIGGRAPGSR